MKAVWARVREIGGERGPSVRVLIDALELKELGAGSATVVVRSAGKLGHAKMERARLGELIGEAMGRGAVEVKVLAGEQMSAGAAVQRTRLTGEQEQKAMQNPVVRKAVELFDARLVAVREGVGGGGAQEQGDDV